MSSRGSKYDQFKKLKINHIRENEDIEKNDKKPIKLRKVKAEAPKTTSEISYSPLTDDFASPTSAAASSSFPTWVNALLWTMVIVAFAGAIAGTVVGSMSLSEVRGFRSENITNDIYINTTNNITNEVFFNTTNNYTIFECCNTTSGGVNVTAGAGINITYLSAEEALIVNNGIRNITAGANANIDYTDPHEPVISCTGGTNITTQGLFTIVDVDVTAADLAGGADVTLFTPSGSDVYIIQQCIVVVDQCVDFSGGGGDREVVTMDINTITDNTVLNYELSSISVLSTFTPNLYPFSALDTNNLPYITQVGVPITIRYSDGTTDWAAGSLHVRLYLLNTNAMAIGGSGDSIVYVKDVSITAAALASGGQAIVFDNTDPAGQYEIIAIYQSSDGGTDFSGGGGDYFEVFITDGTSNYVFLDPLNAGTSSGISGGNGVGLTSTSSIWTPTVAGADLYAIYNPGSGTTDYTTGELKIALIMRKIAGNNAVGVQAVLPGTGISVDSSNPQYPVVSTIGVMSNPTAVLYDNGNTGDLFFLSNRGGNYGLYSSAYQLFLSNNQSIQVDGSSFCYVYDSAIDSSDNVYITGFIQGTGTIFGSDTLSNLINNNQVSYIARTDSSTNWNWAIQSTVSSDPDAYNNGRSIYLDSSNNIYITGDFLVDSTFGATTLTTGASDIQMCFVAKADTTSGWTLAFQTTSVTSQSYCQSYSMYVDNSGNIYITGNFGFDVTFGSTTLISTSSFNQNTFVAKADSTGTWLWAIQDTASPVLDSYSSSYSLTPSNDGNIYIGGLFLNQITLGAITLTTTDPSYTNPFIAKIDASTGAVLWAFDAVSSDISGDIQSMTTDTSGNLYVTGSFNGNQLTFGSIILDSFGVNTIFVAKSDNTGTWVWATTATYQADAASSSNIAIYNDAKLAITGNFYNTITFANSILSANGGNPQIYTVIMDTDGNWIDATTSLQNSFGSANNGIGCNFASDGSIYTTGYFSDYIRFFIGNPLVNSPLSRAAFIVHINSDGTNIADQFAMLAASGSVSDTVSFATYGTITGAVFTFTAGSFYYYDVDAGTMVASTGQPPSLCDCIYIGFALSSSSFLMAPSDPIYFY